MGAVIDSLHMCTKDTSHSQLQMCMSRPATDVPVMSHWYWQNFAAAGDTRLPCACWQDQIKVVSVEAPHVMQKHD